MMRERATIPVSFLLLTLGPLIILPLIAMLVFATRGGLGAFWSAVTTPEALFALRFSVVIAAATSLVNAVLGTITAVVLSRYRFRGREALLVTVNLPVAIPTVVVGTSLLLLWGPIGLAGRYLDPVGIQPMFAPIGVLLAHIFVTLPYMLGAVKPVLDQLDPCYEEAAYTMGASKWHTFWMVVFPALKTAICTGALLTFAHSLGEFGATAMVSGNLRMQTQTAPLYIFSHFEAGRLEQAAAVSTVLALISCLLFFVLLRVSAKPVRRPD